MPPIRRPESILAARVRQVISLTKKFDGIEGVSEVLPFFDERLDRGDATLVGAGWLEDCLPGEEFDVRNTPLKDAVKSASSL